MPEFTNPFVGFTPGRKLTLRELTRGLRLSLAAEEEAVHLYEALADATDNALAKAVLQDVADEEREHVGEFQRVLSLLVDDEDERLRVGKDEVDEMHEQVKAGRPDARDEDPADGDGGRAPAAVGNLKGETANDR